MNSRVNAISTPYKTLKCTKSINDKANVMYVVSMKKYLYQAFAVNGGCFPAYIAIIKNSL